MPELIFEHLPKTAGSTLRNILRRQYSRHFLIKSEDPLGSMNAFLNMDADVQQDTQLIMGHGASQLVTSFKEADIFTMLREPSARFKSQFKFIQSTPRDRNYHRLQGMTLEAYIELAPILGHDNLQTRMLSSANTLQIDQRPVLLNESHLAEAKRKLETFDLVLFTEFFDASLLSLKERYKWQVPCFYQLENMTTSSYITPYESDAVESKIKALERFDLELYSFAYDKWTNSLRSMNVKRFQQLNKGYQALRRYF